MTGVEAGAPTKTGDAGRSWVSSIRGVEPPAQRVAAGQRDLTVGGHPVANAQFADEPERVAGPRALAVDGERARSRLDPPAARVECRQRQPWSAVGRSSGCGPACRSGSSPVGRPRVERSAGAGPCSHASPPRRVPVARPRAATGPGRRSIVSRARLPRSRPARSRRDRSRTGARSPGSLHRPAPARRPQSCCVPDQRHSWADDRTQA